MKKILYLGLAPPLPQDGEMILHHPLIKVIPQPFEHPLIQHFFHNLSSATHILFTSQSAVSLFFEHLERLEKKLEFKKILSVGKSTTKLIEKKGFSVDYTSISETQEGIIEILKGLPLSPQDFFLWPRSALARPLIKIFFSNTPCKLLDISFYDIQFNLEKKLLIENFDEIHFTSPSTVDAFVKLYGRIPTDKTLRSIGPITDAYLKKVIVEIA